MQLQRVIHVSILVDDKRVMLKVPPSLTVSEVVQRGLSSLWRRPVKESEIENICVIRASDPSFSLLAPTFTLEEKGIQDMEELLKEHRKDTRAQIISAGYDIEENAEHIFERFL